MYLVKCLFILLFLCQCNYAADSSNFNPYEVLGLQRTASDQEIRQAYKRLARHWHPDKNSEPNAHDQFTKITAAYEILSDSTKKQNYDEYGTTSQDNHRGFNTNHFRDPYDIFRAHFGGDFRFFQDPPTGAKKIIHTREFLSNILPNSDKKPYVLFGSTNFCVQCRQPLMIFRSLEKQFNDVGISTAEFNVNDQRLSNELGIFNSPSLCVISQRRVYHFNDHGRPSHYTEANIKEFVRKSMPIARYIRALETPDDIISLTSSYNQTNRVYAILITRQKSATLKFVIPCLQYTSRIQCAVFNSSVIMTSQLPAFLKQVSTTSDTVLLFKEDKNPVLVIREHELTFSHVQKTFESNQLLHLPIITSASVFNLVCKTNSPKPCFLIVGDPALFDEHRSSFLFLAKQLFQQYDTRMAYLDSSPTKQIGFSRLLASIYRPEERKLFIIVIRRWFDDTMELVNTEVEFDADSLSELKRNNFNLVADIEANLKLFLTTRWHNAKKHTLPPIFNLDEANENFLTMLINQILDKWNYWFERNHILRSLSEYVLTYQFGVILMVFVGSVCYMKYNPGTNDATRAKQPRKPPASPPSRKPSNAHREPAPMSKLKEFDELLLQRYVTPGAPNVIVLLLIADSQDDTCIGHFNRHISAIHDSRMIFAVLYRDRSPLWLTELCSNIEDEERQRTARFTSSTVLALYIRRKFFVPYWSLSNNNEHVPDDAGAFLGMDHSDHQPRSSSTSSTDSMASTSESLSFSDWIDLLFDGNIRTPISVTEWPLIFR